MAGRQTRLFRKAVIIREDGVGAAKRRGKYFNKDSIGPVYENRRNAFDVLSRGKYAAFTIVRE